MNRFAIALVALTVGMPAAATEFASEPQTMAFDGIASVVDARYSIPIGTNLDLFFAEFWIGVGIELRGGALFRLAVEGMSNLGWFDDDGYRGLLYHRIEPLEGSGRAALDTTVDFTISFEIWDGGQRGRGRNVINFNLFAQSINFELVSQPFTPFLLPTQTPNFASIVATSTDASFNVPLQIPINLAGLVTLTPGLELIGYPETTAIYQGNSLRTAYENDIVSQGDGTSAEIQLYEAVPEVPLLSEYSALVNTIIGYVIDVNFTFDINIAGIVNFPFSLDVWGTTFPLFSDSVDVGFRSDAYAHPLPMVTADTRVIDFGTVEVGDSKRFDFLFNNDGYMDLEGFVGIEGDPEFAASPPEVFVSATGSDGIVVSFSPEGIGDFAGTLILQTNDPYNNVVEVPVIGSAVAPTAPDDGFGGVDGDGFFNPGSSFYNSCGCQSKPTPVGMLPLLALVPLLGLRRRRQD